MADSELVANKGEVWSIERLKNWDKNPRSISDKDFARLLAQIKKLGVYKPLLVTKDGTVLGGNMRLRALQELGQSQVWVSVIDPKDEAEMLEYALSDNDRAGEYDEQQLAELATLYPIDLELYKVDLGKAQPLSDVLNRFGPEVEEDEPPPLPDEAESKLGEVYQLGRHRLMCGDATKIEDVEKLMDGKKADMVFTDPPYNIGFDYNEHNDKQSDSEYNDFCQKWFEIYKKYPLIFTPGPRNMRLYPEPTDVGTWVKKGGKTGASVFNLRFCEPILFYGKFEKKRPTDLFEYNSGDFREVKENYAPAKPVSLIADIIKGFSKDKAIIIDCFGGNGTTLIAAEQTNRTCYMMELDPKYCDVIRKRYAKFIGEDELWVEKTPLVAQPS